MIYLSAASGVRSFREALLETPDLGVMLTPLSGRRMGLLETGCWWGADNGCFRRPERFSLSGYLSWLEGLRPYQRRCLFATAPDVLCDAAATWERSRDVLPQLRVLGYPAALVGQNGLESLTPEWAAFDVLFMGGDTDWKLSEHAYGLAVEAKRQGKRVHMGRVNSWIRYRSAAAAGYDSADGTHIAFAPDRWARNARRWIEQAALQPGFWVTDGED